MYESVIIKQNIEPHENSREKETGFPEGKKSNPERIKQMAQGKKTPTKSDFFWFCFRDTKWRLMTAGALR